MKKLTPPDHNSLVAKDNSLIGRLAKFELSELRLLAFCIAHYDSRSDDNREITARIDDLKQIFQMSTKDVYAVVRRAMIGINQKPYEHFDEYDQWVCDFWFTRFTYKQKTGEFTFKISPEMQPYFLTLKKSFTQYRLGDVYQFKSASTWKLYENLAQWKAMHRWTIELDELRITLGVAGKYPVWKDFHNRVIAPAISEINKYSDLHVEYYKEKRGRKIVGLVFQISTKPEDKDVIDLEPPEDELNRRLLEVGVNAKTAAEYARAINRLGFTDRILAKLPTMSERGRKKGATLPRYVLGAIKSEIAENGNLDASSTCFSSTPEPEYRPALDCWQDHRQQKQTCHVRSAAENGVTPKEEKCRICLSKISIELFGV